MFNLRHIAVNFGGALLPMFIVVVTVPLFLHAIGAEKYGILSIVWLVFGYFGILDFGISRAVTMGISRAGTDREAKNAVIRAAALLNVLIGTAVALSGGAALWLYAQFYPSAMLTDISGSAALLMLGIPVLMLTATMAGAMDGDERFKLANGLQLVASALYQFVPLGTAFWISTDIAVLINSVILARLVVFLLFLLTTSRIFGYLGRWSVERSRVNELVKSGGSIAVVNILDPIFSRVDQLIIAKMAGPAALTAYSIAINSIGRLSILPLAMSRSLFPKLSLGEVEENARNLQRANVKIMLAWSAACGGAIVVSDLVYALWLQNTIAADVSAIGKVFVVGLWANCLGYMPYTILQAGGKSGSIVKAHSLEMPFYVSVLVFFTYHWGAIGAAAAFSIRSVADFLILWKMCGISILSHRLFAVMLVSLALLSYAAS